MPSTYDQSNPFFQQMPFVAIVRTIVPKGGESVMVSELESKRVFFRVGNNRVYPVKTSQDEIFPTGKQIDKQIGFNNLRSDVLNPIVPPSTVTFTSAQFANGFTGSVSTTKDVNRFYMRSLVTLWSGWITGTEAKWTMTSEYGDFDGAVQVAVDGGAFAGATRAGSVHTLFTGLPQATRFVEVRIANGLGDVAYMASTGSVLSVTGVSPTLTTLTNKIQVGADTNLGLYSGAMIANSATFTPPLQAPSGVIYGTNVGSVKIKGAFTKLVVSVQGTRRVGVSQNGGLPVFYTLAEETDVPSRAIVIPCDGSTSTYNIWDSGNYYNNGGTFAVAADSAFLDIGTRRRLDQYGDSMTAGAGATSPADTETMAVAAKLGFVGSTTGISGQTVGGAKTMLDTVLPLRVVGPNDVAILALGGNNADSGIDSTEQADYGACIDKLLAKGYGKVICRGILPLADPNTNAIAITANATLKSVMDAKSNPKLIWVDPSTWTGYATSDGVHATGAGYLTIGAYAYPAYAALSL